MSERSAFVTPVLLGVGSAQVALGLLTPLVAILLVDGGARSGTIGLVASSYFAGFLFGTLGADRVVERFGHRRAFVIFAALAADSVLAMTLAHSPLVWGIARLVMGFQMAGLSLVAESWLNDKADQATRGRIFAAYLLVSWGASAIGPLALNVVAASMALLAVAGIGFATALLPMAMTDVPNPELSQHRHFGLAALFHVSPLGLVCCLASGLINSAFYALAPVYLQRLGHLPSTIAAFISATMVAALLVQYPAGYLSDRVGRRVLMLGALGLGFLVAILLGVVRHEHVMMLVPTGCAFAAVTAPLYGLGAGQMNDRIGSEDRLAASGGLLFAWALGAAIGPGVAGYVMVLMGPGGLFAYLAAVIVILSLFTALRTRLRSGVALTEQSAYVPTPVAPVSLPEFPPTAELASVPDLEPAPEQG